MLILDKIRVHAGGNLILDNISLQFKPNEKIGLTGVNGSGKSTLLKLIAGKVEFYEGEIIKPKEFDIGYLPQEIYSSGKGSIIQETYKAFDKLLRLEKEIKQLETEIQRPKNNVSELSENLNTLLHLYQINGGYEYKGRAESVLKGLGFERKDFDKPVNSLSGGWRMRVELAKILLQNNHMLLLDEPTNHLDMESIIWLENFLKRYDGIVLVVSHDQNFLDNVTSRTIELRKNGKYWDFPYPFTRFLKHKKDLIEKINRTAENQEKEIKETEKLIEKFRYKATKAKFAQSLIKKLEKTERIEKITERDTGIHVRFGISEKPGKIIFDAKNLSKSYGQKEVLKNLNFLIARGEKIAFVGRNGMGKSTLASILAGKNDFEGELNRGYRVKIGYFAQNQSDLLNPEITVLETLENSASAENYSKVRDIAGAFLFPGDDVFKKVKVLSGGEKNRLAMAALLLQPFNVLILDEPTNHLDIPSKNVLKKALKNFDGTLIIVSHDRQFLSGLTHKVWEFDNNIIKEYLGDVNDYLEVKQKDDLRHLGLMEKSTNSNNTKSPKTNYLERKNKRKELKKLQNQIHKTEEEIDKIEKSINEMEKILSDNSDQTPDFFQQYEEKKQLLQELMSVWENLSNKWEKMNR